MKNYPAIASGMIYGWNRLILVTVGVLIASAWLMQESMSARQPAWTHKADGRGVVFSIVSGRDPTGRELTVSGGYFKSDDSGRDLRIIAFDANDGRLIWENREAWRMDPYMNFEPRMAFDADGHLLVGCEYTAIPQGIQRVLTKRSSLDGYEIWSWATDSPGDHTPPTGSGYLAIPAATVRGNIWVSGIRAVAERTYERFIALLDSRNGRQKWFVVNNAANDAFDQPLLVRPLSNQDAIVLSPPRKHERSFPWVLQRINETSGATEWKHELVRDNERSLPWIRSLVDESNQQVLVFWQEVVGGRWQGEVISFDLTTGKQRWRKPSPFAEILAGGVLEASLDKVGNCVLWGREETRKTHVNWLKWHFDPELPVPFPESREVLHVRPVKLTLSSADCSIVSKVNLSDRDESPTRLLADPVTGILSVLFVRTMVERAQLEPWSSIRLDGSSRFPMASGPAAKNDYPRTATVTPSGRVITTGDPTEQTLRWIINAW